jgi:ribosomal protein L18
MHVLGAAIQPAQRRLGKANSSLPNAVGRMPARQALEQLAAEHIFDLMQHPRRGRLRHVQVHAKRDAGSGWIRAPPAFAGVCSADD